MSLLTRKRSLLAKIETIYGTDPTPTGAANAILIKGSPTISPVESTEVKRDILRPYLGNSQSIPVAVHVKLDLEVELAGSGAAGTAPAFGQLLRACGFSETISAGVSVVYAPISANNESITMYFNIDGVLHKLTGARGNVSFDFTAGIIPFAKFSFMGLYSPVTDAAAPTSVFTAFQIPQPVNKVNTSGLSLFGLSGAVMSAFTVDIANNVIFRSLIGVEDVRITDRQPAGSITIEANTIATKDWFTQARNSTLGALAFTHGLGAGNQIVVAGPAVQVTKPAYTDLNGIQMLQMGLIPTPLIGNDELTLTFQ